MYYKKSQFIELKKYVDLLWDFFLWKYKDLYLELFVDFTNSSISDDEFIEEFIKLFQLFIRSFVFLEREKKSFYCNGSNYLTFIESINASLLNF